MKKTLTMTAFALAAAGAAQADTILLDNDFGTGSDIGSGFTEVQEGKTGGSTDTSTGIITTGSSGPSSHYGLNSTTAMDVTSVAGATGFTIDWTVSASTAVPRYNGYFFGVSDTTGNAPWSSAIDSIGIQMTDSLGAIQFVENAAGTKTTQTLGVAAPDAASLADGFTFSITVNSDNTWSASSTGLSEDFSTSGSLSSLTYADVASSLTANTSIQGTSQTYTLDHVTVTAIPEPATLGMVAAFGGGILFIRRRFMI